MVIYELEIVKFLVWKIVIKFVYGVLGVVFYFYNYDVEGVVGGFDNGFYSLLFFVDLIVCYDDQDVVFLGGFYYFYCFINERGKVCWIIERYFGGNIIISIQYFRKVFVR